MKIFLIALSLIFSFSIQAKTVAKLQYSIEFVLQKVLEKKHLNFRQEVAIPKIFLESKTSLKQFQDAIEKQWGQRPSIFTNAFAIANNEIYLLDDNDYYKKHQRCIDDSLAHELVHYIQTKYQGWDISEDESLEWEAIEIQSELRSELCLPPQ